MPTDQFLNGTKQEADLEAAARAEGPHAPVAQQPGPEALIDPLTAGLYAQLLGLMDETANKELATQQAGSLNDILNQQANLSGKQLAASSFASGSAAPANISGILQGKAQALSQGVTEINTAAQARADANQATAVSGLLSLRGQLSAERQAEFDNELNTAIFEWQKEMDERKIKLSEDELESSYWGMITSAAIAAAGIAFAPATGGLSLVATAAAASNMGTSGTPVGG